MALSGAEKQRRRRLNPMAREADREYSREYRQENKVEIREQCIRYRARYPERDRERQRARHLQSTYNLTLEDYNNMLEKQDHRCAICNSHRTEQNPQFGLVIDHCHDTNQVRGLLCWKCNTGLGKFDDDPKLVEAALSYLNDKD